ncbi:restriction endonuclease subunit S [Aliarcobacter butzleri]|uniref:restriction endonuclease subunit S n=1 Tax=Aliarcobacter butzleri TaxID=28197 RepID=UPI0021B258E1|nr:restriction endonuclease subunit S [Aliarcobacter butzleri]MCT7554164.1 restriction endonuclease subunit S [Aliarcobacter butzleri]MCT7589508.1 restriction endonuclease subunit S [Aliarcobacter butzleri]
MSNLNLIPIGKLFDLEKGSLQSSKCTEGEYTFITAAEEWKTHNEYSHECEALIFAAAASGSLGRTHYINDKFITSDLCFILTPKDNKKYPINLKFYHFVFNSLKDEIVKNTKSGTSKESINQSNLRNYEIPYFEIDKQNLWIDKLVNTKSIKQDLEFELSSGQSLLKQLKQTILQEAIEGKLTAKYRAKNPDIGTAKELLEQIKTEKEKLVKEKKIKQGKKQIANEIEDLDIEIPDSWLLIDLDDITQYITDGTHQTPRYVENGRMFLSAQNVKPFKFMPEIYRCVSEEDYQKYIANRQTEKGDLLLGRVGAGIGETAVVDQDLEFAIYVSLGLVKTFKQFTNPEYLATVFNSPYGVRYAKGNISSGGGSAGNFNLGRIRSFPIPFPPLEEQKEIVATIEKLFTICDELESEINQNKTTVDNLMATVLKEAFI